MDCLNSIFQLPLEPVQQLDPYLRNLGCANLSEELEKLADLVLSGESCAPSPQLADSGHLLAWPSYDVPNPASYADRVGLPSECCSSLSPCSSSSSSSLSSSSSSSSLPCSPNGSYPTSLASSVCSDDDSATSCGLGGGSSRRKRNARAAERYRRKLKGRHSKLSEQLELEQQRNARLKRQISSKLSIYGEFVSLLAQKTSEVDVELASLGARSLGQVFASVMTKGPAPSHDGDEQERQCAAELARHLARFERIKSAGQSS